MNHSETELSSLRSKIENGFGTDEVEVDTPPPQHESCLEQQFQQESAVVNEPAPQHQELPKFYPHWRGRPLYGGNQEALGWAMDMIGRSTAFVSAGAFLATALLRLAKEAAGCETEAPPGETKVPECNERIYGIRPSSLLTTYTIVVGVFSSILMPLSTYYDVPQ